MLGGETGREREREEQGERERKEREFGNERWDSDLAD